MRESFPYQCGKRGGRDRARVVVLFGLMVAAALSTDAKDERPAKVPFKDVVKQLQGYNDNLLGFLTQIEDDYVSVTAPSYEADPDPVHTRRVYDQWVAKLRASWRKNGGVGDLPEKFEYHVRGELFGFGLQLAEFVREHKQRLRLEDRPVEVLEVAVGQYRNERYCMECLVSAPDVAEIGSGMQRLQEFDGKLRQMFDQLIDVLVESEILQQQYDEIGRKAAKKRDELDNTPRNCAPPRPECITDEQYEAKSRAIEEEVRPERDRLETRLSGLRDRQSGLEAAIPAYIANTSLFGELPIQILGPHFKLLNFEVVGEFEHASADSPPPFSLTWLVDRQGHFVVKFPASWTGGTTNHKIDIILEESKDNSWTTARTVKRPEIRVTDAPWASLQLDEFFGEWNQRKAGVFRVSLDVGGSVYRSPLFSVADINTSVILSLNERCLDLLGLAYSEWSSVATRDADAAKLYLWRQIYLRALGFNPSVDVLNLRDDDRPFTISLRVNGKFASKEAPQNFVTVPVYLGKGADSAKGVRVVSGEMRHLLLEPFALAKNSYDSNSALQDLTAFELIAEPDDNVASQKRTISVDENLRNRFKGSSSKLTLGSAMREFGPKIDGSPLDAPLSFFEKAFAAPWHADVPKSAHDVYRRARDQAEGEYKDFLTFVETTKAGRNQWGDTGLVDLELKIAQYRGWKIGFGIPRSSTADLVSATGERDTLQLCGTTNLTNSTWAIGVSAVGAFFDPEYSLAMNPAFMGASGSSAAGPARSEKLTRVPGIDDWLWETDASHARHELLADPAVGKTFDRLMDPQSGGPSAALTRMLANPEFNHVVGEINEAAFRPVIDKRVETLKKTRPEFANNVVHVGAEKISGPALNKGRGRGSVAPQKLTDGITFGKKDGKIVILEAYEAKAGQATANGIASQFAKDILRIKNFGLEITDATPEEMKFFGRTTPNFRLAPEELVIPSAEPGMYVSLVPKGVSPKAQLETPDPAKMRDETKIRALSRDEEAAINRAVEANTEHAEYSAPGLENVAKAVLQRAGKMPPRWDDPGLNFDQFKKIAAGSGLSSADLLDIFMRGERYNPESGETVDVFRDRPAERPFLSKQQIIDEWQKATGLAPSDPGWAKESAKAAAEAEKGNRFIADAKDPKSGKWVEPLSVQWGKLDVDWGNMAELENIRQQGGSASTADKKRLALLEGSLSDEEKSILDAARRLGLPVQDFGNEFRKGMRDLQNAGKLALNDKGEVPKSVIDRSFDGGINDPFLSDESYLELVRRLLPADVATDKEILESRKKGRVFDTGKRNFRDPTTEEKALQGVANQIKGNKKLQGLYENNVQLQHDLGWAAVEGLQRQAAFFNEIARRRGEGLLVNLYCDAKNKILQLDVVARVTVEPGKEVSIPLGPLQQKEMLKNWYRHADHVFTEGPLPDWLKN
jgi:hypothetical protein